MTNEQLIAQMTDDIKIMADRIKERMKMFPFDQQIEYLKSIRYLMVEVLQEIAHVKNNN